MAVIYKNNYLNYSKGGKKLKVLGLIIYAMVIGLYLYLFIKLIRLLKGGKKNA